VYLVCSPIPDLVELESNMIDACVAAGVKQVVLNSAMGAGDYDKSFPSWHSKVEEKLKSTRLGWTILRPACLARIFSVRVMENDCRQRFLAAGVAPRPLGGKALRQALGRDEHRQIADEMARFA
jgi:hypothetical protein